MLNFAEELLLVVLDERTGEFGDPRPMVFEHALAGAVLMDLAGWTTAEMGVAPRAGMVVTYPRVAGGRFGGRRGGQEEDAGAQVKRQVTRLTDYFRRAREYRDAKQRVIAAGSRLARPDAAMEAMIPVLDGTVPVVFDAGTAGQIRGALAVADSFGLRPIIRGGQEAWQLADELARRKVTVIVGPTTEVPGDDPREGEQARPRQPHVAWPAHVHRRGVGVRPRPSADDRERGEGDAGGGAADQTGSP